jgi:glycosyltransferase involved in cell wall biosynthesis
LIGDILMNKKVITISTGAVGGIRSVVENYMQSGLFNEFNGVWLISHEDGSVIKRLLLFAKCFLSVNRYLFTANTIFHIHMSMKGSFFRKMIYLYWIKLFNGKVILHLHGSEFAVFYNKSPNWCKKIVRRTFERADKVLVLSNSWRDFVQSLSNGIKTVVLPNYVEPIPEIRLQSNSEFTYFVFLGAIGKRKGVYDLLPAFAEVLKENSKVKLIICGDGELKQAKMLAEKLHITPNIEFVGWVSGTTKHQYLNLANVVVLPSYNEGLPMVILEAMSLAKSVLSTRVGGIPEAIVSGENGYLVEAGDIAMLTSAMLQLCNPQLRDTLGQNAKATYIQSYSASAVIPKLRDIYRSLL